MDDFWKYRDSYENSSGYNSLMLYYLLIWLELADKDWRQLYTWIDLNAPHRGAWNNQRYEKRRLDLAVLYAGLTDNPEEEYRQALAAVERQTVRPVKPKRVPKPKPDKSQEKANYKLNIYLSAIIALVSSGFIAQFCIGILARDVKIFDDRLGSVVAQPATGQIVFAVLVSFGLAAFVVKTFLDTSYIWPIAASALITGFAISIYVKQDILQHLVQRWPTPFFSNAVVSILPVQIVAFGTLGSIAGYWLAVRHNYWRRDR